MIEWLPLRQGAMVTIRRVVGEVDMAGNDLHRDSGFPGCHIMRLPDTFAPSYTGGRWLALAPSTSSLASGRILERRELRAVDFTRLPFAAAPPLSMRTDRQDEEAAEA